MLDAGCANAPCHFKTTSALTVIDGDNERRPSEWQPDEFEIDGAKENAAEKGEQAAGFIFADPDELNFGGLSVGEGSVKKLYLEVYSPVYGVLINKISFFTEPNPDFEVKVTGLPEEPVYSNTGDVFPIEVELWRVSDSGSRSPLKCQKSNAPLSWFTAYLIIIYSSPHSPLYVPVYSHPKCK